MEWTKWLGLALMAVATHALPVLAEEQVITRNNVSYVSGGVGIDSEERLKAQEKQFNLKLVLTLVEGNYLADVAVTVQDGAGKKVLEHVTDGPIFLAKLPAGAYSVTAVHNGKTQTRKVSVRADRLHTEYLRWPSDPQRDVTLPPEGRETAPTRAAPARAAPAREAKRTEAAAGISYVSGGIGEDSEAQLKAREKEFNLKLVFTLIEGNYLADVNVAIRDAGGKALVEHLAEGPFLLARLPTGTYAITATYEGKTQSRKVKVGERLQTEYFRWAANPQTDFSVPRESAREK
jgi:enamine deaminase RidA (YjgF/YER057c/UK114 family)